jgi:hypothetical protein
LTANLATEGTAVNPVFPLRPWLRELERLTAEIEAANRIGDRARVLALSARAREVGQRRQLWARETGEEYAA